MAYLIHALMSFGRIPMSRICVTHFLDILAVEGHFELQYELRGLNSLYRQVLWFGK